MKIKKEFIILGVILIILIGYLVFQNLVKKTHFKLPDIEKIEEADLKKIILEKPDETMTFEKENEKWYITPQKYPVDKTRIDDIVTIITEFTITDLVSESRNYVLYELDDDQKINIQAYSTDGEILLNVDVGKSADTYNHTFVKLHDNPNVYYAKENFKHDVNKKLDELRDKAVMSFEKDKIYSITLNNTKEELILNKEMENAGVNIQDGNAAENPDAAPKEIWKSHLGQKIKEDEINTILDTLKELKCDYYIEGKKKTDFETPIFTLLAKGTKDYMISIFEKEDNKYPAFTSENDYPFLLPGWKTERFMKEYSDLFDDETD